ncbi:hypothetical protein HK405_012210, partial [Cladochytrium tenue]
EEDGDFIDSYSDEEDEEVLNDDEDADVDDADVDEEDDPTYFEPVVSQKDVKKSYEVDFTVHTVQDIVAFQRKEARHVSGVLGISEAQAATLLRAHGWNKERLVERYMDSAEAVCADAGVVLEGGQQPRPEPAGAGFECGVCCDDTPGVESLALSCGHRFCRACYERYLTQKVVDEGESRRIQCLDSACKVVVDEATIQLIVPPHVFKNENAVECKVLVSMLDEVVPTVVCACGFHFCFGCGLQDHQPCICSLVKLWLKKCADDSETANWISANTKECEKCQSTIEKNGGFCWVCLGPWSEHGTQWYNCNRFDEKTSIDARDSQAKSRAALERYLHYYNRFANHEQSAKLDKELYEKTEKKMEEMQKTSGLSWIEVQFLKKAVESLLASRMTLKWTYCLAYYLTRGNATDLFEDNQRDLEMAVEQLSEMLEKPIDPEAIAALKQQVLDKSAYVAGRREVLLTATAKDLLEHRWRFNVDVPGFATASSSSSSSSAEATVSA